MYRVAVEKEANNIEYIKKTFKYFAFCFLIQNKQNTKGINSDRKVNNDLVSRKYIFIQI